MKIFISALFAAFILPAAAYAVCGDENIEANEDCEFTAFDEPLLDGNDCTDVNFVSGTLRCDENTCRFITDDCSNEAGPLCGNGAVEAGEDCEGGCACNDECEDTLPQCGNACVEGIEECDANNSDTIPDACRTNCVLAGCGDGVTDTGEQCDDYPDNSNYVPDACRSDCSLPRCGDGVIDVGSGEQCDRGVNNSDAPGSPCTTSCIIPFCGNGIVEAGETCDDGNPVSTDACTQLCRPNTCGDGLVHAGEEHCDGVSCSYACDSDPSECGNGVLNPGEECDDGGANADVADAACRTDCSLRRCGDAVVDSGEACDRSAGCLSDCTLLP